MLAICISTAGETSISYPFTVSPFPIICWKVYSVIIFCACLRCGSCRGSGSWPPASHHTGPGSGQGLSVWNLWLAEWQWYSTT